MNLLKRFKKIPKRKLTLILIMLVIALLSVSIFIGTILTGKIKFFAAGNARITNTATVTFQNSTGDTVNLQSNTVYTELILASLAANLTLNLQGRSTDQSISNGLLTVFEPDDPQSKFLEKTDVSFDSSGRATLDMIGLTIGQNYDYKIKPPKYLSNTIKNTPFSENINLNFGTLLAGDLDNNNLVNSLDFAFLNSKFGRSDPIADIDQNGKVNSLDFAILNANFAKRGQ